MRRIGYLISLTLATLLMSVAVLGQSESLGDIARENREKKAAQESSSTPPKVITNHNLPRDPDASPSDDTSAPASTPKSNSPFSEKAATQGLAEDRPPQHPSSEQRSAGRQLAEQHAAQQRADEQHVADQWKRRILQQESTVANLRMRADRLKASIHFANVNTYNDMPVNRYQARQIQRLRLVQHQLDMQQRKLEDMQEAARHAGMHTLVYDP